MEDNKQ